MKSAAQKFAPHVVELDHRNPFPGMFALQQRIGRPVHRRLSGNESLDAPISDIHAVYGDDLCQKVRLYGDPACTILKTALADANGFEPANITVDAGADSVLALCLRALCVPGDSVVCSAGTYPTFAYLARATGCRVIETPYHRTDGKVEIALDALLQDVIRTKAKALYIANPDNPTGSWCTFNELERLLAQLPDYCMLLLDEAYIDFCSALHSDSARLLDGCIRIRSLSKSHALAGLRIGYALAAREIIEQLQKVRIHYAVGGLAQYIAQIVVSDHREAVAFKNSNAFLREKLNKELRAAGYKVLPSGTNFISLLAPDHTLAERAQQYLLQQGIAVHRPEHPAVHDLLRITICKDALDGEFIKALGEALR